MYQLAFSNNIHGLVDFFQGLAFPDFNKADLIKQPVLFALLKQGKQLLLGNHDFC